MASAAAWKKLRRGLARKGRATLKEKRIVKKAVKAVEKKEEHKWKDFVGSLEAIGDTIGYHDLCGAITQGTSNGQRVGNKINVTKIEGKYQLANQTASDSYNSIRLIGYQYKNSEGYAPTWQDMFISSSGVICLRNESTKKYFNLWHDRTDTMPPTATGIASNDSIKNRNIGHVYKNGMTIQYMSNSGYYGDVYDNDIGIAYIGTRPYDGSKSPTLQYQIRVHYTDA